MIVDDCHGLGLDGDRRRPQERAGTRRRRIRGSASRAGLRDAGMAARNMELLANLPKPDGFFDPAAPAGAVSAARAPDAAPGAPSGPAANRPEGAAGQRHAAARRAAAASRTPTSPSAATNVVVGNYHGFNTYDIENARKPRLLASVVCPGGQGDVSIHGNLLFMSVEQTRGRIDCGVAGRARRR